MTVDSFQSKGFPISKWYTFIKATKSTKKASSYQGNILHFKKVILYVYKFMYVFDTVCMKVFLGGMKTKTKNIAICVGMLALSWYLICKNEYEISKVLDILLTLGDIRNFVFKNPVHIWFRILLQVIYGPRPHGPGVYGLGVYFRTKISQKLNWPQRMIPAKMTQTRILSIWKKNNHSCSVAHALLHNCSWPNNPDILKNFTM